MMSPWTALNLLGLLAGISVLFWRYKIQVPLPPGPPGHWLWGNHIPPTRAFLKYAEWTKQYGPVISLRSGRRRVIVIGGYQAGIDILEKEGAVTADRPRAVAGGEIMSGGMRVLLVGVGERLRKLRRALHLHLQSRAAAKHEETQTFNARQLIRDIVDDPTGLFDHTQRYAASIILSITYGRPSPSFKSDPDVSLIYQCLQNLGQALRPGAHLVDDFPWLKYLPFYGRALREQHAIELDLFRRQMQGVRDDIAAGKERKSFGKYLIEAQKELALSDDELAYLAGSMFGAGSDTTASALRFLCMAAACFPEAQKRVQDELDEVIGSDRLPTFADWDDLPQVHAFFLEVFRWRPATASGIQHRATQDIIYNGYRIPAGAIIIPNHWSIGRDPDVFPNGDSFNPQRWIDAQGKVNEDHKFANFGYGRRLCPGFPVATRSLFINTALLLQSFRISEDPEYPIDTLAVREGVIMQPAPFRVRFEVRREDGAEALKALLDRED